MTVGTTEPERQMPAESLYVVIFFCCVFAVAIAAIAYAQSTAPKS
jgi:hypothetical protein